MFVCCWPLSTCQRFVPFVFDTCRARVSASHSLPCFLNSEREEPATRVHHDLILSLHSIFLQFHGCLSNKTLKTTKISHWQTFYQNSHSHSFSFSVIPSQSVNNKNHSSTLECTKTPMPPLSVTLHQELPQIDHNDNDNDNPRMLIVQNCLLLPVVVAFWWYWTRRTAKRAVSRYFVMARNESCDTNTNDDTTLDYEEFSTW